MDNTISNLQWVAFFRDDTKLIQFDSDGHEHLFKEVQERFNDLVLFALVDMATKKLIVCVDLIFGYVSTNLDATIGEEFKEQKLNKRLIFFRRHTVLMGAGSQVEENHKIDYYLGYQYNDEAQMNHKVIVKIDSNGNMVIGG